MQQDDTDTDAEGSIDSVDEFLSSLPSPSVSQKRKALDCVIDVSTNVEASLMAEISPSYYYTSTASTSSSTSDVVTKMRRKGDELRDQVITSKGSIVEARTLRMHQRQSPKGPKSDEQKLDRLRKILNKDGVLKPKEFDWNEIDSSFAQNFHQLKDAIFSPVCEPLNLKDVGQVRYHYPYFTL